MNYWLLKTEPEEFSIDDLKRKKKALWDGVRNFEARNNIRKMKQGDLCLIYHSGKVRGVAGIGKVVGKPLPDPKDRAWSAIYIIFSKKFSHFLDLEGLRGVQSLKNMVLWRKSRLSVQPVSKAEFQQVLKTSKNVDK